MKTIITSLLILSMTASHAFALPTEPTEKGKTTTASTPATPAAMTMQQLMEENARLKAQLVTVENRLEEEKSILQFKYTMQNMLSSLEAQKSVDMLEDAKSLAQFRLTMQRMFNAMELQQKAEMLEDMNAKANFNRVMGQVLLLINSR